MVVGSSLGTVLIHNATLTSAVMIITAPISAISEPDLLADNAMEMKPTADKPINVHVGIGA